MIRYGTNPIAWSNDDDRSLGAHIPLNECLNDAARIGFAGIERGHKMPDHGPILRRILLFYKLVLASAWYSSNLLEHSVEDELRMYEAHVAMLQANDCEVSILCDTSGAIHGRMDRGFEDRPRLADDRWQAFAEGVTALSRLSLKSGIMTVYHPHMGTIVQTDAEIDRLMAATTSITGLLLDTGHITFAGGSPVDIARRHASRIRHIHAKNVRRPVMEAARRDNLPFLEAVRRGVFTVPGDAEGMVDFEPVLRVAAETGYEGWLVVEAEQDPAVRDPKDYQAMGLEALKRHARAVGLDNG